MADTEKKVLKSGGKAETDEHQIKIWSDLLDVLDEIKKIRPWDYFCSVDLTEIHFSEDEVYYCSASGYYEPVCGVSVYKGQAGLLSVSSVLSGDESPDYIVKNKKQCMEVIWGPRKSLKNKELGIIKKTGHKYRGSDAWPIVRRYDPGMLPWYLSDEDAEEMTKVLVEYVNSLRELYDSGQDGEMSEGDRISRFYDEDTNTWKNKILPPVDKIEAVTEGCIITDELLLRRMKKHDYNGAVLEYDVPYLPVPVRGSGARPFYPRICIICDSETGMVENQFFIKRTEELTDVVLGLFIDYVQENGRPDVVYVRDLEMLGILGHLCKSIDVDIYVSPWLYFIDSIMGDMLLKMNGQS